jgi:hypothetical protein
MEHNLEAIAGDSPEGKELYKVHALASRIRGDFVGQAIWLDILIVEVTVEVTDGMFT